MTCPTCGGVQREELAPGFYRCLSTVRRMGYMPAPGIHSGPVPLVPGPEFATCGAEYQEGPVRAELGLCSCGMAAVALCVDCARALCGRDLVRQQGVVVCGADAERRRTEEEERRFRAALERVTSAAGQRSDPTERALILYVSERAILVGDRYHPQRAAVIRDSLRALLTPPSPAFAVSPTTNWVELTSAAALAQWAFRHPEASRPETLRVVKIVQYLEWLKIPRGRVQGLRIANETYEPPTGDFRTGSYTPATYLLEDGSVVCPYNGYLEDGRPNSAPGAGCVELARTLGLPEVR